MTPTTRKLSRLSPALVVLSLVFFTLLWAVVTDAWGTSSLIFGPDKTSLQKWMYDITCRLIWVAPVFVLLRQYRAQLPTTAGQMFRKRMNLKLLFFFLGISTVYAIIVMRITHGGFHLNPDFSLLRHTSFYLMVGFVEELVYRGWAMNAFSTFFSAKRSALYSTLFFILLHWPAYFIRFAITGSLAISLLVQQSLVVLVMGLIFSYIYHKEKSIWTPIIVHAYYDWIFELLV